MQLTITLREVQDVACLDLSGKILIGDETDALQQQINKLLAAGMRKILLNMSEVNYLDSTGVGTVVGAFLKAKQQGGKMALLVPPGPAEKIGRIFGPLVEACFHTEEEALASFR